MIMQQSQCMLVFPWFFSVWQSYGINTTQRFRSAFTCLTITPRVITNRAALQPCGWHCLLISLNFEVDRDH